METAKERDNNNDVVNIESNSNEDATKSEPGRCVEDSDQIEIKYEGCSYETVFIRSMETEPSNNSTKTTQTEDNKFHAPANIEEPIDLTFSQRAVKYQGNVGPSKSSQAKPVHKVLSDGQIYDEARSNTTFTIAKIVQADHLMASASVQKKRGRKRKENIELRITRPSNLSPTFDNPDYVQTMDSRQAEVLMAAKSLFSKRTRTLYHWMYPNTPKTQLKSAVSMSWETLGVQEKEFYISQVLGRFGFPQSSLMINPQLGGLRGVPILPPLDLNAAPHLNMETHHAVSTILENQEPGSSWSAYNYPLPHTKRVNRRRGRLGRPPGSKTQRQLKDMGAPMKPVAVENITEDFPDDPELRQEFEQFKWALHMNDK